jgi:hypothetical protein
MIVTAVRSGIGKEQGSSDPTSESGHWLAKTMIEELAIPPGKVKLVPGSFSSNTLTINLTIT